MCPRHFGLQKSPDSEPISRSDRWFLKYPALKAAYDEAVRRYGRKPGVHGFGIGRKYQDKSGKYARPTKGHGGMCVKVIVQRKKSELRLPKREQIACSIEVEVPSGKAGSTVAVPIDVIEAGGIVGHFEGRRGYPTANRITSGRLFAVGKTGATRPSGKLGSNFRAGTIGAVFKLSGDYFATSAGHVFVGCARIKRSNSPRRIGVGRGGDRDHWTRVATNRISPRDMRVDGLVRDAMLFRIPRDMVGTVDWPSDFNRRMATNNDIDAALRSPHPLGYVWVERKSGARQQRRTVDLREEVERFTATFRCNGNMRKRRFGFAYRLAFKSANAGHRTIGGDSGSPVFIRSANGNEDRLLGFHFYRNGKYSYAVDAKTFIESVLGPVGDHVKFA